MVTHCVLLLLALCATLAHSFSWEIVVGVRNRLEFIDVTGTVTHTEQFETLNDIIRHTTYDPVHNRVLFADTYNIYSFDIATKKTECLIKDTTVFKLAYDPATELLFWVENLTDVYSISLKPEFNDSKVIKKRLHLKVDWMSKISIDSCAGLIYWMENFRVYRARFNGSEREVVINNIDRVSSLTIDQYSQKMYFADKTGSIKSADLNGKNIRTIFTSTSDIDDLTVSKDFIYCTYLNIENENRYNSTVLQMSKNRGMNMKPKIYTQLLSSMAANYNIEDITRENQNCDTLKSLLLNNSVSTDNPVSLLYVNGTKVSEESRCECTQCYSGEKCNVSVCHNYCLHGDCYASDQGQPKCSCTAGYSGERCEVNACQGYCLNDGVCSLSEERKPLCRCIGHYEGERCDVPVFQIKCFQAISLFKDLLDTDVTSDKVMLQLLSKDVKPMKSLFID